MLDAGDGSCAMEATSHGSALGRLDGVRFASLIFTNLSQDHLDFHPTMEDYFDAKRRLFIGDDGPPAAVNVGDEYGRRLAEDLRAAGTPLLTFGLTDDADIGATNLESTPAHTSFAAAGIAIRTRLRGRFNVENVLGVVAAARLLELPDDAIATGIASVAGVPGRFESIDEGQPFTVVVDYAHKPGALENVLRAARELATGRVICVFGAGGDRDPTKRPLMGRIAEELSDVSIVTSDNPRSEDPLKIIEEIQRGITVDTRRDTAQRILTYVDRREAIGKAVELARPGDVVLIAGKGHEKYQIVGHDVRPFDDVAVARDALGRKRSNSGVV
jgi:UDP-N-acetylmuramoyl-L-alanyl-D-glutamate--2,6-diaminopimelate ligase